MNAYWILGIVVLVALVGLGVYFATRTAPTGGGFFGSGAMGGRGSAIGSGIAGALGGLGAAAASIGSAVDAEESYGSIS